MNVDDLRLTFPPKRARPPSRNDWPCRDHKKLVWHPDCGSDLAEFTRDLAPGRAGILTDIHLTEQAERHNAVGVGGIVVYIQDIDFLPNPRLGPGGRLTAQADDAAQRGERLFTKPFPHDPGLSCAACHIPSAAFVDHQQRDVGSGGLFKTPTLLNANSNAPYFHDGRYDNYDQVVAHFDRVFGLDLGSQDRSDLVAYMTAVGDGLQPYEPDGVIPRLTEITDFASVLSTAIPAHDTEVITLAVDTVGSELCELTERFPAPKNTSVSGGWDERRLARAALKGLVLCLRRIGLAGSVGHFDEAATE